MGRFKPEFMSVGDFWKYTLLRRGRKIRHLGEAVAGLPRDIVAPLLPKHPHLAFPMFAATKAVEFAMEEFIDVDVAFADAGFEVYRCTTRITQCLLETVNAAHRASQASGSNAVRSWVGAARWGDAMFHGFEHEEFIVVFQPRAEGSNTGMFIAGSQEKAIAYLSRAFWAAYPRGITISEKRGASTESGGLMIEALEPRPSHKSAHAEDIVAYLSAFFAVEKTRGVLLHGPPGTGKTAIAERTIESLGLRTIEIKARDSGALGLALFLARVVGADVIFFDDFDRMGSGAHLLSDLDDLRLIVSLVIATVNVVELLDHAILRSGRFDYHLHIERLDDAAFEALAPKAVLKSKKLRAKVRDWPVCDLNEITEMYEVFGKPGLERAIAQIENQVRGRQNLGF